MNESERVQSATQSNKTVAAAQEILAGGGQKKLSIVATLIIALNIYLLHQTFWGG